MLRTGRKGRTGRTGQMYVRTAVILYAPSPPLKMAGHNSMGGGGGGIKSHKIIFAKYVSAPDMDRHA